MRIYEAGKRVAALFDLWPTCESCFCMIILKNLLQRLKQARKRETVRLHGIRNTEAFPSFGRAPEAWSERARPTGYSAHGNFLFV